MIEATLFNFHIWHSNHAALDAKKLLVHFFGVCNMPGMFYLVIIYHIISKILLRFFFNFSVNFISMSWNQLSQ